MQSLVPCPVQVVDSGAVIVHARCPVAADTDTPATLKAKVQVRTAPAVVHQPTHPPRGRLQPLAVPPGSQALEGPALVAAVRIFGREQGFAAFPSGRPAAVVRSALTPAAPMSCPATDCSYRCSRCGQEIEPGADSLSELEEDEPPRKAQQGKRPMKPPCDGSKRFLWRECS